MAKNIGLLHFAYPPAIGGVEILLREHAHILTELGNKVKIITGSGKETNPHIELVEIPEMQSLNTWNPDLQENIFSGIINRDFYVLSRKLHQLIQKNTQSLDTIIVHNMLTVSRNLPFIHAFHEFAKNTDKHIVVYTHDHMYIGNGQIKNIHETATSTLEKKLLTTPIEKAVYIAISNTFCRRLVKVLPVKNGHLHIIQNGINIRNYLEMDPIIWHVVEQKNILSSFPIILSPSNILERKNLLYTIDVVAELKKKYPSLLYIISGKPSKYRSTIEYHNQIQERIQELGLDENFLMLSEYINKSLRNSEIHDLYSLADVVLYFSKSENFGLPILEASLAKTPIFVSDLKVFHEVGGDLLTYIDYRTVEPKKAAEIIAETLSSTRLQINYKVRTDYNLKNILSTLLVPLL